MNTWLATLLGSDGETFNAVGETPFVNEDKAKMNGISLLADPFYRQDRDIPQDAKLIIMGTVTLQNKGE